jgi:hypothetical protein
MATNGPRTPTMNPDTLTHIHGEVTYLAKMAEKPDTSASDLPRDEVSLR